MAEWEMLTLKTPSHISARSVYFIIRETIGANLQPKAGHVCLDFSDVSFVDADGVASLSSLIEWLRAHGVIVDYTGTGAIPAGISYLDDAGFFEAYWGAPLRPTARLRSTTYPFKRLTCAESHQWIDGNVFPWIAGRCGVPERAFYELKTCVRELFNNIKDHSTQEIGCMHVQEYPKVNKMRIAVSDFGIGIPNEVRKVLPNKDDPYALISACEEGFTSKPNGRNMGAGLSYLIDNVVCRNYGFVGIYSGMGQAYFSRGQNGERRFSVALSDSHYPGTLVSMILRTDLIQVPEEEPGEMQW